MNARRLLPRADRPAAAIRFAVNHTLSSALLVLNPHQLRQAREQLRAVELAHEPPREARTEFRLPLVGRWLVANGGTTRQTSHSWDIVTQRYAYDFLMVDGAGRTHVGTGNRLEDYHAYGRPVVAPAGGRVVRVVDGIRDAPRVGTGWVDWRSPDIAGNSITIEHEPGEYSLLAHLMPGSPTVRPEDPVLRGQPVARVGNSGRSTEPHLHFQVQGGRSMTTSVGLIPRFRFESTGGAGGVPTTLTRGDRVDGPPAEQ